MEIIKHSYRDIIRFNNAAISWQIRESKESKLKYAISRTLKNLRTIISDYESKIGEINIESCSCDDKGNVLTNATGGFTFSKEGLKKQRAEDRKLQDTEVEVEVYFATAIPDDLTIFEQAAFAGFVIPEFTESA